MMNYHVGNIGSSFVHSFMNSINESSIHFDAPLVWTNTGASIDAYCLDQDFVLNGGIVDDFRSMQRRDGIDVNLKFNKPIPNVSALFRDDDHTVNKIMCLKHSGIEVADTNGESVAVKCITEYSSELGREFLRKLGNDRRYMIKGYEEINKAVMDIFEPTAKDIDHCFVMYADELVGYVGVMKMQAYKYLEKYNLITYIWLSDRVQNAVHHSAALSVARVMAEHKPPFFVGINAVHKLSLRYFMNNGFQPFFVRMSKWK